MKIKLLLKLFVLFLVTFFCACSFLKHPFRKRIRYTTIDSASMKQILEAIRKNNMPVASAAEEDEREYRAAATKTWDLVNTDLDVSLDYTKAQLIGRATITVQPHAYAQDSLVLDAKGMDIKEVFDGDSRALVNLMYRYDGKQINIKLRYKVMPGEQKKVSIQYVSKPNDIITQGSEAITSDKGLYFINNTGADSLKPRQVWTQGETESNSCWFPTIDKPNQKMTQSISITLADTNDITLSNGKFYGRRKNNDGTVTDTWVQSLPAAPYLTMMAIGKFHVEHDTWRDKEVNYYVEPSFKPFAKLIFGKTPAMIDFFSKKLGVDYAWEKYSQIVVRDYVSGSMENVSATLHGEFLNLDAREYLDDNKEDYISHELFHQWFGDLLTCESWSNLPLNESFATYGEYLWIDHSRGAMEAGKHLDEELKHYLQEANFKQKSLIRFHYDDKEDMFDRHSYQKGACILHMLRTHLGDDIFFKGVQNYLTKNKFKSVEVHDLRLAMEEVSGEDLNWFFNQWFLRSGHPKVGVGRNYNPTTKSQNLTIDYLKEGDKPSKKYRLPIKVDFYFKDSIHSENIIVKDWTNSWDFPFDDQPLLINIDAERAMLWEVDYPKTKEELMYQLLHAPRFQDKKEAIDKLLEKDELTLDERMPLINYCLDHEYYGVKALGMELMEFMRPQDLEPYYAKLSTLVFTVKNSALRVTFLKTINRMSKTHDIQPLLRACSNDSSYMVSGTALELFALKDMETALKICASYEALNNVSIINAINTIYSKDTLVNHADYFKKSVFYSKGFYKNIRLREVDSYIRKTTADNALATIQGLVQIKSSLLKNYTGSFYADMENYFQSKKTKLAEQMARSKYTEEGYKAVKHEADTYDAILNLLK